MNEIQKRILQLFSNTDSIPMKFRAIGRDIDVSHPQTVIYHLEQLEKQGFISIDKKRKRINRIPVKPSGSNESMFVTIPVRGYANCGSACVFATDQVEGFLKISKGILERLIPKNLFALRAEGDSMNKADINGRSIEDGDFVLIDSTKKDPREGSYVVSIIDDCANIKKFHKDDHQITLTSESTQDFSPIFIHEDDKDHYWIAGEVVKVLKGPKK
ncbi:hypothetical protein GF406_16180 [candidate division KSB1 bacterium]|nr:hypothetical protein [candidate division KSB1 bacterium]